MLAEEKGHQDRRTRSVNETRVWVVLSALGLQSLETRCVCVCEWKDGTRMNHGASILF